METNCFLQQLRALSLEEGRRLIAEEASALDDHAAFGALLTDEALEDSYANPTLSLKLAELLNFFGDHLKHPSSRALGLKAKGDMLKTIGLQQAALESLDEAGEEFLRHGIVTLINQNLDTFRQNGHIPIVAAMPNWMGGGTGGITVNCPACPPVPLTGDKKTYSNWHFTLPQLSPMMQDRKGHGVTMFVLDTIPTAERIRKAALQAANHNVLLQSIAKAMDSVPPSIVVDHQWLPKRLTADIQAGKDLKGRLFGFKMPDHGLFVAGIIHDLVPDAKIECVRILNDYGVGDAAMLCHALHAIQEHMAQGKLGQVVVNLSLAISPSDANLPRIWFGDDRS